MRFTLICWPTCLHQPPLLWSLEKGRGAPCCTLWWHAGGSLPAAPLYAGLAVLWDLEAHSQRPEHHLCSACCPEGRGAVPKPRQQRWVQLLCVSAGSCRSSHVLLQGLCLPRNFVFSNIPAAAFQQSRGNNFLPLILHCK